MENTERLSSIDERFLFTSDLAFARERNMTSFDLYMMSETRHVFEATPKSPPTQTMTNFWFIESKYFNPSYHRMKHITLIQLQHKKEYEGDLPCSSDQYFAIRICHIT